MRVCLLEVPAIWDDEVALVSGVKLIKDLSKLEFGIISKERMEELDIWVGFRHWILEHQCMDISIWK